MSAYMQFSNVFLMKYLKFWNNKEISVFGTGTLSCLF